MRKLLLIATALVLGAGVAYAQSKTKVEFLGFPDFNNHLDALLPDFHAKYPNIEVTYSMSEWGDHHNKLTTNLAAGAGAGDVVVVDVGKLGSFVNAGGFENLSAPPYGADQFADRFASYAWAQGKGVDGNQYAIPIDLGPGVMYFRRDHLDALGMKIEDVIKDWDSYIAYGERLKERGVYLIADATDVAQAIIETTVEPGNGIYFNADGTPALTSDRFVKAFETAKRIRELGLDKQISAWTNEWYGAFQDGSVATQLSGAWLLGHLKNWMAPDTAGKWGVANLPDGIYGSWGGSFVAIPKQSQNKEAAWEFIRYLTLEPGAQVSGLKVIGSFPALVDTYKDPVFEEEIEFLAGQKARQLFAEVARKVRPVKVFNGDNAAFDIVYRGALPQVLNEGRDIREALEEAAQLLQRRAQGG